jgi:molecular chaperone HscB
MSFLAPSVVNELKECWSCAGDSEDIFCLVCGALQPLSSKDYFSYLDLECDFELDIELLEKSYLNLQGKVHPDRFVLKSQQEKNYSKEHSSFLNLAYETLKDSYARGKYMLKILNKRGDNQESSQNPALLAFIFEQREKLEEADSSTEIMILLDNIEEEWVKLLQSLATAFKNNDFSKASFELERLKYFMTFKEETNLRLNDFEEA